MSRQIQKPKRHIKPEEVPEIIRLYTEERKTSLQIADILGCSDTTILTYLKKNNIDVEKYRRENRSMAMKGRIFDKPRSGHEGDLETIIDLYANHGFRTPQIAEIVGLSFSTVSKWLNRSGFDVKAAQRQRQSETLTGRKHSEESRRKRSKAMTGFKHTPETIEKMKRVQSQNYPIAYWQEKHPFFCQIEPIREDPETGRIQVTCKLCGNWYFPTRGQMNNRARALENEKCNEGSYFYCSDECRGLCPVYRVNPNHKITHFTDTDLVIWSKHVIARDKECLYCGSTKRLQAHHINPKSTHPKEALDPANGITVCKDCHSRIHNGECSAPYLAANAC